MSRPNNQEELNASIYEMAQSEIKDLQEVYNKYQKESPDNGVKSLEEYREPLSMDMTKQINIMLSWGGPSDGYKLDFDKENNLLRGVYWYADWGTYAETPLDDDQLQLVVDVYMYSDSSEFVKNMA